MLHDRQAGMTLAQLIDDGIEGVVHGEDDQRVTGVQHDSRRVQRGDLFAAIPGASYDGGDFVADAVSRGAAAVMAERRIQDRVPELVVPDVRLALAQAAERVYGSPSERLQTIGVTGTNGKTTVAYLLRQAIDGAGGKAAVLGTTGWILGHEEIAGHHTTPEGDDISRVARDSADRGATHLVLEVSSHGLALRRVDGLRFRVAAFTNLSRDHLDFHGTLEAYGEAKARLFTELAPTCAVVHVDDPFGAKLASRIGTRCLRCSRRAGVAAEIVATEWSAGRAGVRARVETPAGEVSIESPLIGEHNLENLLVALGCAVALDLDLDAVISAWRTSGGIPGRLERVPHPGDIAVLVDYAHTPDALEHVLHAVRDVTPGRVIVVFGAGGDRDRGKRPEMGRVGAELSDLCVLTSDNPRTEDPRQILAEVEAGANATGAGRIEIADLARVERGVCSVLDRRTAIGAAISAARPGDTVLLAGKGHETYQIIGTERTHFDDREEARAAIAAFEGGA